MWDSNRPPLPDWVEEIYSWFENYLQTECDDNSLDRTQTAELAISAHPDLELSHDDIEYAFNRLINRGYLYQVDEQLSVTEFHDQNQESDK